MNLNTIYKQQTKTGNGLNINDMKKQIINFFALAALAIFIGACGNNASEEGHDHKEGKQQELHEEHSDEEGGHEGHGEEGMGEVHLSNLKFQSLGVKVDTLPTRPLSGVVYANGQLEVPPQHEATVTAILGGNITAIKVIEGDKVSKGQVLAYLSHPDLSKVQTEYLRAYSSSEYLEQEFNRQKKLWKLLGWFSL